MSVELPITAVGSFSVGASDTPTDLAPWVKAEVSGQYRRINRLIQLALIGVSRCRRADPAEWPATQPIVMATGQGCVADTAHLLTTAMERHQAPMPFEFINVAGNMAGFYVARCVGAGGSNLTVSSLADPVQEALSVVMLEYLASGCALLGAVDEVAWPLSAHRVRLDVPPETALGEGSHWLRFGADAPAIGYLEGVERCVDDAAVAACLAADAPDWLASDPGPGVALEQWLERTGAGRWADIAGAGGYHETAVAGILCRFLEAGRPGRLAHIGTTAAGDYVVLRLRSVGNRRSSA